MAELVDVIIPSLRTGNDVSLDLKWCLETVRRFTDVSHRVLLECSDRSASTNRNRALSRSDAEYVCFLDDDAWVTPGWIRPLLDRLKCDVGLGMIGPKVKLETGRIFCFGMELTSSGSIQPVGYSQIDDDRFTEDREPFALPTTCLLVRRAAIAAAGLFDEAYGSSQWEDVDYYMRLVSSGFNGIVTSRSVVYHRNLFRTADYDVNYARFMRQWGHLISKRGKKAVARDLQVMNAHGNPGGSA